MKHKYKFLLIPNASNFYDINQLAEIKSVLVDHNHTVDFLDKEISDVSLINLVEKNSYNCVLRVNKGRPEELKKNVRFISWFQDFYYNSEKELNNFLQNDLVYFYTTPEIFGVDKKLNCFSSILYPGISEKNVEPNLPELNKKNQIESYQNIDFSICGFMPASHNVNFNQFYFRNFNTDNKSTFDGYLKTNLINFIEKYEENLSLEKVKKILIYLQSLTEILYEPLSGNLDTKFISKKIEEKLSRELSKQSVEILSPVIKFFSTEYPRFQDRIELARLLTKHSSNFTLVGKGWDVYDEFSEFYKGEIQNQMLLYGIYKKSKINLYNNTHGLGMHNKVFEIMINGGFIALPSNKSKRKISSIEEDFEENTHFVYFDPLNFDDFINEWLFKTNERIIIGNNARQKVLKNHSWKNRVEKILNDLNK